MSTEQFANVASTTLNGTINNSVTSLVVASATGFPSSGQFRILIESEILLVTAVAGTTFTVTRGAESTTAASHTSGVAITHVLTKGAIDKLKTDVIAITNKRDVIANLPSAGNPGTIYLPTDEPVLLFDNGASWNSFGPIFSLTPPPATTGWSWVNQGSAIITATAASWKLSNVSSTGMALFVKTAPATPWTMEVLLLPTFTGPNAGFMSYAICFYDSVSGKLHIYEFLSDGTSNSANWMGMLGAYKYTSVTVFSATYFDRLGINPGWGHRFVRVGDDGTNRHISFSADGVTYMKAHTIGRTDFVTADKIGFATSNSTAVANSLKILHMVGP